jgi:hypothetical protein
MMPRMLMIVRGMGSTPTTRRWSPTRLPRVINGVERKFAECWKTLTMLKELRSKLLAQRLVQFQPTLCAALVTLATEFEGLSAERGQLIHRSFRGLFYGPGARSCQRNVKESKDVSTELRGGSSYQISENWRTNPFKIGSPSTASGLSRRCTWNPGR